MAGNKKRIGLDQPHGDTLTGIDRLLAEMADDTLEPDEFTLAMICERLPHISLDVIRHKLDRMVGLGVCTKRKLIVNSNKANVYRYV
jgi:hypothetical protein